MKNTYIHTGICANFSFRCCVVDVHCYGTLHDRIAGRHGRRRFLADIVPASKRGVGIYAPIVESVGRVRPNAEVFVWCGFVYRYRGKILKKCLSFFSSHFNQVLNVRESRCIFLISLFLCDAMLCVMIQKTWHLPYLPVVYVNVLFCLSKKGIVFTSVQQGIYF